MKSENISEVDVEDEQIAELLSSNTITLNGTEQQLSEIGSDIQTAHAELDEYKSGSLSLSQTLSEAAKEATDETLTAILADMSDAAFGVYLRLHRGDLELLGGRDGEYSGFLSE